MVSQDDIDRRASSSYMLLVGDETDAETESELNNFMEMHQSIDITPDDSPETVREMVSGEVSDPDRLIVVHKFREMDSDLQLFISQYLKGIAETYVDLPIIVFGIDDNNNPAYSNRDLSGRVYRL
jgi:hypothetical protein